MTLPFPRAAGKKLFHGRYSHPPNLPYKKLPSFISLPLLQAVGGVIDASDGLWALRLCGAPLPFSLQSTLHSAVFLAILFRKSITFFLCCAILQAKVSHI